MAHRLYKVSEKRCVHTRLKLSNRSMDFLQMPRNMSNDILSHLKPHMLKSFRWFASYDSLSRVHTFLRRPVCMLLNMYIIIQSSPLYLCEIIAW